MDLALVGLGRMGLNMALRLLRGGHRIVVHNRSQEPVATAHGEGAENAAALADLLTMLAPPRVVWLMLPAGPVTDAHLDEVYGVLEPGDVIVDGGNAHYHDTLRRAATAAEHGLRFVDVGVSGGVWGLANGYSLMVGGPEDAVVLLEPALKTLAPAPDRGWGRVGPVGAGHYTKMVHNGIEYGMMQAFAEGFALLEARRFAADGAAPDAEPDVALDLAQIAEVWRTGSVVQSWLLDLTAEALAARPGLAGVAPFVPDSGEGLWTVQEALDLRVPTPVIAASLFERFQSRTPDSFAYRLLSAMRGQFGAHPVKGAAGTDGLKPDGTLDLIPGGPRTEGATTR
ncbi:MAG TPA: decarboxylating 6-phosphogluconate dehydrogenase [Rhodothermales bacterium]|nr:decarboxylating 6-phosphogluconate dehydrogenase [Rhodothermales bacterium]